MRKLTIFDLISLGAIVLIAVFSAARFNYLPQFIDGYYHLSVANGFIKSGGWIGWAWWDFAPFGRPHLYPPLYHFILVFLIKTGISGLNALRLTEAAIVPLFFFFLWLIARKLISDNFAFLLLFATSSFFAFYSSVSANVPASLAMIFGFLSWFFLAKKKRLSAAVFMTFCFYSHAAIPWIFFGSLWLTAIFSREWRKLSLKIILLSTVMFTPFLFHGLSYIKSAHLASLMESKFISLNIGVMLCAGISLYLNRRNKSLAVLLFWGYLIVSTLVFAKYPYRFFSAQGFAGFAFFASLFLLSLYNYSAKPRRQKFFVAAIAFYLFFMNATLDRDGSKIKFNLFNSTFYNFASQKAYSDVTFRTVFSDRFYLPIIKVIAHNSAANDIISSNSHVAAQIFSALSNRPSANSMLEQVKAENKSVYSDYVRLYILIKPVAGEFAAAFLTRQKTDFVFENGIAYVLLNKNCLSADFTGKAPLNFVCIAFIVIFLFLAAVNDNYPIKLLARQLNLYRFFRPK